MKTSVFGPQTEHFARLLSTAEHLSQEQRDQMSSLRSPLTDQSRMNAWDSLFSGEVDMESMLTAQFLDMYSSHYPLVIIEAALAVATRHLISDEDYQTLVHPWESVAGPVPL